MPTSERMPRQGRRRQLTPRLMRSNMLSRCIYLTNEVEIVRTCGLREI